MNKTVELATSYLVEVWRNHSRDNEKLCSYGMALAACALAGSNNVTGEILRELKSRIQSRAGNIYACGNRAAPILVSVSVSGQYQHFWWYRNWSSMLYKYQLCCLCIINHEIFFQVK